MIWAEDHPRRCGENSLTKRQAKSPTGSPPQVRGKRRKGNVHSGRDRITPAGAGKTEVTPIMLAEAQDHPRRCGENDKGQKKDWVAYRITPAGAGKTSCQPQHSNRNQDHPRRCGENFIALLAEQAAMGSPPQVRGKRTRTPRRDGMGRDHPRRCGENLHTSGSHSSISGSPPQVRGKQISGSVAIGTGGITPAGAGKTQRHFEPCVHARDHPRRCGENSVSVT